MALRRWVPATTLERMTRTERAGWWAWAACCLLGAAFAVAFAVVFGPSDPVQRIEGQPVWAAVQATIAVAVSATAGLAARSQRRRVGWVSVAGAVGWLCAFSAG